MSKAIRNLISATKSGVAQIVVLQAGREIGTGSGFVVSGRLVTNAHVIPTGQFDSVRITFGGESSDAIELTESEVANASLARSEAAQFDFAVLALPTSITNGRYNFEFQVNHKIAAGDEVMFFGFPFGTRNLTCHTGRISSLFTLGGVHRFQIDGSINPGNSGGPLIDIESGACVGIVTKTQTGLERDFNDLLNAIHKNVEVLSNQKSMMSIGGINPVQATLVTMAILGRVADNLKRTANVGIGYAYCAEHICQTYDFKAHQHGI